MSEKPVIANLASHKRIGTRLYCLRYEERTSSATDSHPLHHTAVPCIETCTWHLKLGYDPIDEALCFDCLGQHAHQSAAGIHACLGLQPTEAGKAQPLSYLVVHAPWGIVEVGMCSIECNAVAYGTHHRTTYVVGVGDGFQRMEEQWMMAHHHIATALCSLGHNIFGHV